MPRRAIISDIHGNLVALEAVLADIKSQGVDEIVCLGDICGYGPQPVECIRRVREVCAWVLMGNHDEALFVAPKDFSPNALISILWQRSILEPKEGCTQEEAVHWTWLKNLPASRKEKDVLYVHASPRDPLYEYVLREDFEDNGFGPPQKARELFASIEGFCFCGHSHRPGVVAEDYKWRLPSELEKGPYLVRRGLKTFVNVGSAGQPRDGITSACYCIFNYDMQTAPKNAQLPKPGSGTMIQVRNPDMSKMEETQELVETRLAGELEQARNTAILRSSSVMFRRVEYDIAEVQARFKTVPQLPENNWRRLAKGE
jgi:predicted phosphodiesterase